MDNSTAEEAHKIKSYEELKIVGPPLYAQTSTDFSNFATKDSANQLPIEAGTTALLIVDVQPEYWSECPAVRQDFPEFPSNMANLISTCRERRAKIIWVRADYRYSHSPWLAQFARLHKGRIPDEVRCSNTKDLEWEGFAKPLGGEFVIPKTSWSSTSHTSLIDLLKQSGINTVLVCGLITSVCVQHSAFGIFEAGYRTILVTDACADRGRARHEAALALYGDYMYELVSTTELEQNLQEAEPVWLGPEPERMVPLNQSQHSMTKNHNGGGGERESTIKTSSSTNSLTVNSYVEEENNGNNSFPVSVVSCSDEKVV